MKTSAGVAAFLVIGVAQATMPDGPTRPVTRSVSSHRSTAAHPTAVATPSTVAPATSTPTPTAPLDLSEPTIRKAIADSRDPLDDVVMPRTAAFGTASATRQGIDQAFRRAEIPTCMTPEAYRFDPPQIGAFGLGGFLALPFLVHAIVTGQCRY